MKVQLVTSGTFRNSREYAKAQYLLTFLRNMTKNNQTSTQMQADIKAFEEEVKEKITSQSICNELIYGIKDGFNAVLNHHTKGSSAQSKIIAAQDLLTGMSQVIEKNANIKKINKIGFYDVHL